MRPLAMHHLKHGNALIVAQLPAGHRQIIDHQLASPHEKIVATPIRLVLAPDQAVAEQTPHGITKLLLLAGAELTVCFGKIDQAHDTQLFAAAQDKGPKAQPGAFDPVAVGVLVDAVAQRTVAVVAQIDQKWQVLGTIERQLSGGEFVAVT